MRSLVASVWEALVPGVSVSADLDLDLLVEEVETSETGLEVILPWIGQDILGEKLRKPRCP